MTIFDSDDNRQFHIVNNSFIYDMKTHQPIFTFSDGVNTPLIHNRTTTIQPLYFYSYPHLSTFMIKSYPDKTRYILSSYIYNGQLFIQKDTRNCEILGAYNSIMRINDKIVLYTRGSFIKNTDVSKKNWKYVKSDIDTDYMLVINFRPFI
jgi:hypothetical protein